MAHAHPTDPDGFSTITTWFSADCGDTVSGPTPLYDVYYRTPDGRIAEQYNTETTYAWPDVRRAVAYVQELWGHEHIIVAVVRAA